ncbi:hypothetical protein [Phycicoccus avicenniae]|uniref:hypothetical protein n=1 Tax=Phycicoccus avicenniae TaxID=2828860 RepID=UPI003D2B1513
MRRSRGALWPAAVLVLTMLLMVVGLTAGWESFNGKGFVARVVVYPVLMLVLPVGWWWRHRGRDVEPPWGAFALVMLPFLVDVVGNFLDLYDTVAVWDDVNHLVNWFLLLWGIGLLLFPGPDDVRRPALAVLTVAGAGALLAVLWEVGEWFVFLRAGVEVERLYQDTLGDELLGTTGALLAGVLVAWWRRRTVPTG